MIWAVYLNRSERRVRARRDIVSLHVYRYDTEANAGASARGNSIGSNGALRNRKTQITVYSNLTCSSVVPGRKTNGDQFILVDPFSFAFRLLVLFTTPALNCDKSRIRVGRCSPRPQRSCVIAAENVAPYTTTGCSS